jgi:hypothetical protein
LEGNDLTTEGESSSTAIITTARDSCMRMYLDLERYDAAFRLGERFSMDSSCVIRFSVALLAFRLQKEESMINKLMLQAIKSNIFATLYLCHYDTFVAAFEFTEELQDADDEPQNSFEEALEYCSSAYASLWQQTDGAIERLQRSVQDDSLTPGDREWSGRLSQIVSQHRTKKGHVERVFSESGNDSQPHGIDIPMFAGMFRTAMDMIEVPSPFYR